MMKQMVVTYDTEIVLEVLHTIKSFSNANNHELFSCAPFSEILDPPVHCIVVVTRAGQPRQTLAGKVC